MWAKAKARWDASAMAFLRGGLYGVVLATGLAWRFIPRPVGDFLACRVVGSLLYWTWPRWRRSARQAMARVQGPRADRRTVERLARRSIRHYCLYASEFLRHSRSLDKGFEDRFLFEGWENLEEAARGGKGTIIIGLHLGNWDLAAAALARRNYPINVVVERFEPPLLDRAIQQRRQRTGVKTIPMDKGRVSIVRALRRNEMLAILLDQPNAEARVTVNFFNAPARVPASAARLALRTGARVVTGGLVRLPGDRFLGFVESQILFAPSGDMERDAQALTQMIVTSLEKWVRRYPDQWYPFRPIWAPTGA